MRSLDKYLNELFWGKKKDEEKIDSNLPNPYNFRALKLDPNITSSDWKKAQVEWSKRPTTSEIKDVKTAFLKPGYEDNGKAWVIIDNGERVGIVGAQGQNFLEQIKFQKIDWPNIVYVTWVHGKKYAARGVMKMLELPIFDQERGLASFKVYKENKFSLQVVKDLKAKFDMKEEGYEYYELKAPWWWSKPKKSK